MPTDTGIAAYASLSADVNKQKGDIGQETKEGVVSTKLPELTLEMSNEDIVKFVDKCEKRWTESPSRSDWKKQGEDNEKYWLGQQHDLPKADKTRANVDNLIFESLETYLPETTRRNPEPLVTLDASEVSDKSKEEYVQKVKNRLADLADKNKLRLKLKKVGRHWSIFLLGAVKFGWDLDKDIPIARVIRPQKLILDPDSTIDEDGYTGGYIGEYRKLSADKILKIIGEEEDPDTADARKKINDLAKSDLGTDIQFIEFWTPQYMCWKLEKTILLKKKNPHWNYDKTESPTSDQISSPGVQVDDYGNATANEVTILGINHFPTPKMPYEFLSVFNLGDQPMDKTSLIGQNLSNQDQINKRNRQIDKNADDMNGGMVVSLARSGLTQPQAKNVTNALRKGGAVVIPDGAPREAIDRYPAPGLPPDIFNDLADKRARLRDIFGTRGSSAAGLGTEKTVRGKIMSRTFDTDRIGGGVSEYLEQLADDIYNWFVQLLYVYDAGFQFVGNATPPKIVVSVKEGSLLPKDSITLANQAIELGLSGKMSLIDMYKQLEYPNPEEMAANVWLEVNMPHLLYKDNPLIMEAMALQQSAATEALQMEDQKAQGEHERGMEKEMLKGEQKLDGEVARSMLSQVPVPAKAE